MGSENMGAEKHGFMNYHYIPDDVVVKTIYEELKEARQEVAALCEQVDLLTDLIQKIQREQEEFKG